MQKRILYIGNKLSKAVGTVTTIDTLSFLLKKEGYDVSAFSQINNKAFRLLDMLYRTIQYRRKVDVVLIDTYSTQNFYYAVWVAKICRYFDIPYIPILHGGNLPERLKKTFQLSQKLFKGAKTNVTPSMYLYEAFKTEGYNNLTYIPNTIEINKYPFLLRNEITPKLLWVRAFSKVYNPLLALKVVEEMHKKNIKVSLCMVGPEKDGALAECKKITQQKNLPITFTGKLEKVEWVELSKEFDVFINTTNFDNTPVSVIEAMALGLPVVSTNVGGLPYLIDQDKTGILVPPDNEQAFVQAIIKLMNNPSIVEFLSKRARAKVEGFDWENVKGKWNAVLS